MNRLEDHLMILIDAESHCIKFNTHQWLKFSENGHGGSITWQKAIYKKKKKKTYH